MATNFLLVMVVAVLFVGHSISALKSEPVVETNDGSVKGSVQPSAADVEVQEYLGIPFAKAPVGELRYADPEPIESWEGIKETVKFGASCYQPLDLTFGDFHGSAMWNAPNELSEDCLFLNVWTPHPRPENADVMVWIFGGGFYSGTSALAVYDGKTLAGHSDVIVVSMNYRVGSFGFLATGDGRIKGNFGLKDQMLALQWVQDNIEKFGGNPSKVTIMGESAGAASVGYHMLSPTSSQLFNRAIMQSGSPDAEWAFMDAKAAKERSKVLFDAFKCEDNDKVMKCLRAIEPKEIVAKEWVTGEFMVFPWAPTTDNDFITEPPRSLIKKQKFKKTDVLLGVNKDEGTFWILYAVGTFSKDNSSVQTWEESLDALKITDYDIPADLRETMLRIYTNYKGEKNQVANRDAVDDIVGDRSFICPTLSFANSNIRHGVNTYFYRIEERASNEVWPDWMGVIHGAEIQYVFGIPLKKDLGYNEADKNLAREVMTYWSNFAKYGTPNGHTKAKGLKKWPKYNKYEKYLNFGADGSLSKDKKLREFHCNFWNVVNEVKQAATQA